MNTMIDNLLSSEVSAFLKMHGITKYEARNIIKKYNAYSRSQNRSVRLKGVGLKICKNVCTDLNIRFVSPMKRRDIALIGNRDYEIGTALYAIGHHLLTYKP